MEGENIVKSCLEHSNHEARITNLEDIVKEILLEMKTKAVSDAQMKEILQAVLKNQELVQQDVKELRVSMMSLVTETLQKSRDDMSAIMKMQEENQQKALVMDKASHETATAWYRKVIFACIAVFVTIVLAFFGIKSLIPLIG